MAKEEKYIEKYIKDFIYLDRDRLNSLYSQVFEGVAESIVKSRLDSEMQSGSQKGLPFLGEVANEEFAKAVQMTENTILYDYIYEQLEQKLHKAIVRPKNVTSENFREVLEDIFLLNVKGKAEISDFEHLKNTLKDFNKIGKSLTYLTVYEQLGRQNINEAKNYAKTITDQKARKEYLDAINFFSDLTQIAKISGLYQDEEFMKILADLSEKYYLDAYEVTITQSDDEKVVFRGVLNKQWLRIQPSFIRQLFSGSSESDWTMVGQITYLPTLKNIGSETSPVGLAEDKIEQLPNAETTPPTQSLRDTYNNMQKAVRNIDKVFTERHELMEIVVYPLAIYRESSVLIKTE